jgi:hypothetical protein
MARVSGTDNLLLPLLLELGNGLLDEGRSLLDRRRRSRWHAVEHDLREAEGPRDIELGETQELEVIELWSSHDVVSLDRNLAARSEASLDARVVDQKLINHSRARPYTRSFS